MNVNDQTFAFRSRGTQGQLSDLATLYVELVALLTSATEVNL